MSSWADRSAEEAEEEEDGVEADFRSADDHVLFLVDARPAMFSRSDCGEAFIVNCLRVAQSVMKSKIVASDRSTVGVILFGAVSRIRLRVSVGAELTRLLPQESKPKSDVVTASASHPQACLADAFAEAQLISSRRSPLCSRWTCPPLSG